MPSEIFMNACLEFFTRCDGITLHPWILLGLKDMKGVWGEGSRYHYTYIAALVHYVSQLICTPLEIAKGNAGRSEHLITCTVNHSSTHDLLSDGCQVFLLALVLCHMDFMHIQASLLFLMNHVSSNQP